MLNNDLLRLKNLSEVWRSWVCSPWGDLITIFQFLKGSYKEDQGSLFPRSYIKTRYSRHKPHQERFCLDISQLFFFYFFSVRTSTRWNNLPRNTVASPPPEVFKL